MAAVPTLEQDVFPQQGVQPNASGTDFGAQVGEAQQGLGAQVSNAGDVMAEQVLKWQGLKNQATANDLDVQFQGDLGKLEDNFYSLKGKAQADAYNGFVSDVSALRQKYLGVAPNPMVKDALDQTVGYSIGRSIRSAGSSAGEQTRAWMIDAQQSRVDSLHYNIVKRYNDNDYAATGTAAIDSGIDDLGSAQGWSPEHIALAKQQEHDQLTADRQKAALEYAQSQPVADVMRSLVGGTATGPARNGPPGEAGGAAYKSALVHAEFASGQDTPGNAHQGPVQADDAWLQHFGSGKARADMTMQDWMDALDRETAENKPKLEKVLGRPVTDADLYLAHQQGEGGAEAILLHPNDAVSAHVPVGNIAANIPTDPTTHQPVADANTVTGAQFAGIWSKGFDQTGGALMANNPATRNNQLDSSIALLSDAQKMALTKSTIDAWHTQDAAYREQTNFQQEQQAKAEKQQYDLVLNQAKDVMAANWANPGKNQPLDVAQLSQTTWGKAHPEAVTDLINYGKNFTNKPDNDKTVTAQLYRQWLSGKAGVDDFQAAYAPKDGSPGSISHDSLDWLVGLTKGKNDPNAEATKGLKEVFTKNTEKNYLDSGMANDPAADQRFNVDFETKWEAFVAAGKDPRALVTPGNNDYFGSLQNLSLYSTTAKEELAAENEGPGLASRVGTAISDWWNGTPGAPTQPGVSPQAQPAEYKTMADIQGAINRHEISLADGKKYAIDHGIGRVVPKTAAENGPAAPND